MTSNTSAHSAPKVFLLGSRPIELGLAQHLESDHRLLAHHYSDPFQFLRELEEVRNGCIVADLKMPGMSGLQLIRELDNRNAKLTILLLSTDSDLRACRTAFQMGAFDFIEPNCPVREIVDRILQAISHNRKLIEQSNRQEQFLKLIQLLSSREREVAELLASGNSLKKVSENLQISPQTASKHRIAIFQKLQVENEVELYRVLHEAQLPAPYRLLPQVSTPSTTLLPHNTSRL